MSPYKERRPQPRLPFRPDAFFGLTGSARFSYPYDVAVDGAGNVYVTDRRNHTIRKVTPAGAVTTLAGREGYSGSTDGTGSAVRFSYPFGVATDGAGNIYVADSYNHTIRKVTPAGVVTTLAGRAGYSGSADGTGSAPLFSHPQGIAVDPAGNVYVADTANNTIRKVTPAGIVTTLAGLAGNQGSADGTGSAARFTYSTGVAVDSSGAIYVADTSSHTIRRGYSVPMILSSGPGFGFTGGQFGFVLTGPSGQLTVVEASTDLVNWLPVLTNTLTGGSSYFSDPQWTNYPARFYRLRSP